MKQKQLVLGTFLSMMLGLTACGVKPAPEPTGAAKPTMVVNEGYLNMFETVWQTVNDTYFDATFGGLDWNDAHDQYHLRVADAENDEVFYEHLNQMLYELNVSHIGVYHSDFLLNEVVSPYDFAQGSVGIDVRLLEGDAVIVSIEPGSPAERAGLRPGFVIHSVEGISIGQITDATYLTPPYNERNRLRLITQEILRRIYGPPGTPVSLSYSDGERQPHVKSIQRVQREGGHFLYDGGPPLFADVESKLLDNGIGYIRFSSFTSPLSDDIFGAIDSMGSTPGLIIDVRGNTGGDFDLFVGKLVRAPVSCLSVKTRGGTTDFTIEPEDTSYSGPVAVLIDVMSVSAAELFPACLQAIGRAVVIGERSPGTALGTKVDVSPDGVFFVYPDRQYLRPDGSVVEGLGVVPDVAVALERRLLLKGIDSQLEAAISYLESKMPPR